MNGIKSFTDLETWKEGHKLVLLVYKASETFPSSEKFGLTNQIRRAIVSFTSNIAEGFSRKSFREKVQYYYMALGSLTEAQNQLIIARDLGYLDYQQYSKIISQIIVANKLIHGLIKSAKSVSG